jgi:hypothetical protein
MPVKPQGAKGLPILISVKALPIERFSIEWIKDMVWYQQCLCGLCRLGVKESSGFTPSSQKVAKSAKIIPSWSPDFPVISFAIRPNQTRAVLLAVSNQTLLCHFSAIFFTSPRKPEAKACQSPIIKVISAPSVFA